MIKYYPSFRIQTGSSTTGGEYSLNGQSYKGDYYTTFDGKVFAGKNPIFGLNQELSKISSYRSAPSTLSDLYTDESGQRAPSMVVPNSVKNKLNARNTKNFVGGPVPFYPKPIDEDYQRGYLTRYFIKKENDKGFITEISESEYFDFSSGKVNYDVSFYHAFKITWKITGPLNKVRVSQYDTRAGIIDTNERLVLEAEKTFVGIKDFIGGEYDKFARPTK
jgi:hypothetical protein